MRSVMMLTGLASLIGLWVLVTPFAFEATDEGLWSNAIAGFLVFLIAGMAFYSIMYKKTINMVLPAIAAVIGLYIVVSPYVFDIGVDELLWSNVVAGLVVFVLTGYSTYAVRDGITAPREPAGAD